MNRARTAAFMIVAVGTGSVSCGGPLPRGDPFAAPAACTSGIIRDANESEGALMMPGYACNACHEEENASTGEGAPVFRFAGTIYPSGHEPDGCVGSQSDLAEVWVKDATGFLFSARANESGNFMLETADAFVPPFSAEVRFEGRVRPMLALQTSGDCNACHTQHGTESGSESGTMNAPGRIVLP